MYAAYRSCCTALFLGSMEERYLGEDLKIKITVDEISGYSLSEYDWEVEFWINSTKRLTKRKDSCIYISDDSYAVCLNTEEVGAGLLKLCIIGYITDKDFPSGERRVIGQNNVCIIHKRNKNE